jgi:HAD superfamily hydrolase (TIGR01509 family)
MIRAVVFDLGGVYFTDGFRSAINKFHRRFGIPAKRLKKELVGGIGKDYCTGRISRRVFWKRFQKTFKLSSNYEKLDGMWNECYYINPDLRQMARKLKKGLRKGILSSTSRHRLAYLNKKYDFFKDFHYRQFSYRTKTTKSDEATFHLLAKKLKLQPQEILYIDDEQEHLRPARRAGLKTLQFRNNVQLERELRKLKLLV